MDTSIDFKCLWLHYVTVPSSSSTQQSLGVSPCCDLKDPPLRSPPCVYSSSSSSSSSPRSRIPTMAACMKSISPNWAAAWVVLALKVAGKEKGRYLRDLRPSHLPRLPPPHSPRCRSLPLPPRHLHSLRLTPRRDRQQQGQKRSGSQEPSVPQIDRYRACWSAMVSVEF